MKSESVLVLAVMVLLAASASAGTYSGGTGEPNDPYRIATANDLNDIGNHVEDFNKCFVMVNDINLADYNGTRFNMIGSSSDHFVGVFDGNEHSIANFTYQGDSSYVGLFCRVGNDDGTSGEIKNLTLVDPNVDAGTGDRVGALASVLDRGTVSGCGVVGGGIVGSDNVGGLVGMISFALKAPWEGDPAILTNCYSTASVSGNGQVGGLAGGSYGGIVTDSYSTGTVSGSSYEVGGLVGANYDANILDSYSTATVSGESMVGGLVGGTYHKYSEEPIILNCYAAGTVTAADNYAGGLVGDNDADFTIRNCYSSADVNGDSAVGGLVGGNQGDVFNCYSSGSVNGAQDCGGLVGGNFFGDVSNCYAFGTVCGDIGVGGLVGYNIGHIIYSYSRGRVYGEDFTGGLVGKDPDSDDLYTSCFWDSDVNPDVNGIGNANDPNVIGKSTAEMQMESTFTDAGWDFVEVWGIGEGQTYPFLRVYPAGDLNHDGIVNFIDVAILAEHWLESIE